MHDPLSGTPLTGQTSDSPRASIALQDRGTGPENGERCGRTLALNGGQRMFRWDVG